MSPHELDCMTPLPPTGWIEQRSESASAARPFLTETDRLSLLDGTPEHREWYQRAVEGRVGPPGTSSGPLPDDEFCAALRAMRGAA